MKKIVICFNDEQMGLYNDLVNYAKKQKRSLTNYCRLRLEHNIELEKIYDKDIEKKQPSEEFMEMMNERMGKNKNILKRLAGK